MVGCLQISAVISSITVDILTMNKKAICKFLSLAVMMSAISGETTRWNTSALCWSEPEHWTQPKRIRESMLIKSFYPIKRVALKNWSPEEKVTALRKPYPSIDDL